MSTISNERIEQIMTRCVPFHGECAAPVSVIEVKAMATELLALRKDRERAEPVATLYKSGKSAKVIMIGADLADGYTDVFTELQTAPPAPVVVDDSLPYDPQIAEYEQMMEAEQAQADTTAQQFESLAGKAVGGSEGFECTPVADLYELLTKCGECYDYTTSPKVAADWIKEGYSAREYVKLDRLQEALIFAAPEQCK